MYDFIVILFIVFPYLLVGGLEIYDKTEYARRRRIKGYSEELIQLLLDVNYDYFRETIECWCEINHKKVINNRIL